VLRYMERFWLQQLGFGLRVAKLFHAKIAA
jgi:hypothetical protein